MKSVAIKTFRDQVHGKFRAGDDLSELPADLQGYLIAEGMAIEGEAAEKAPENPTEQKTEKPKPSAASAKASKPTKAPAGGPTGEIKTPWSSSPAAPVPAASTSPNSGDGENKDLSGSSQ